MLPDTLAQSAKSQFKVGYFTAGASTGNVSVTGVGFKPRLVEFTWILDTSTNSNQASGSMDEDGNQFAQGAYAAGSTTAATYGLKTRCLLTPGSSATTREASFVSMDEDGFTINFTKAASSTDIGYKAYY